MQDAPSPILRFRAKLAHRYYIDVVVWDSLRDLKRNDLGMEGGRAGFEVGPFTASKYKLGTLHLTRTNLDHPTLVHECVHVAYELRSRSAMSEEWVCRQIERLFRDLDRATCHIVK